MQRPLIGVIPLNGRRGVDRKWRRRLLACPRGRGEPIGRAGRV